MWCVAEFVLKNYLPKELEEGMLFINRISVGVIEPYVELWELKEVPKDIEEFISKNGAPIELLIIDDNEDVLAFGDQIGWWDEGEHTDELRDISIEDINTILREHDGYLDIELDDYTLEASLYEDKVLLRFEQEEE